MLRNLSSGGGTSVRESIGVDKIIVLLSFIVLVFGLIKRMFPDI